MGKTKDKDIKTNAMRILDKMKIKYKIITYECNEFISGVVTAQKRGADIRKSYKTLVAQGKSNEYYVLVLPVAEEIDLKKAAKVLNEKSVEMIPVKDIQKVTGYIRGGCSPLGMKKQYKTVIQSGVEQYDTICISGGRIGSTIELSPMDLQKATNAEFDDFIQTHKEEQTFN